MNTQLIKVLFAQYLSFVVLAVNLNPSVANQVNLPDDSGICQNKELQTNIDREKSRMGFYLNNPDGIHIISDRQESVVEFFQGHRIVVAMVTLQDLKQTLTKSQVMQNNCFVAYPSFNYDGSGKIDTYGFAIKLAPVSLEVIQFWKKYQPNTVSVKIFLEQDSEDSELYHFVGWTEAEGFSFSSEESLALSLKSEDLWYREK